MRFLYVPLCCLIFSDLGWAETPIFPSGATLKVEAENGAGGEGPAWHPQLGVLSSGEGHIYQLDRAGKSRIYRKDAGSNACSSTPRAGCWRARPWRGASPAPSRTDPSRS